MLVTAVQLCLQTRVKNYFYFPEITDQMNLMKRNVSWPMEAMSTSLNLCSKYSCPVSAQCNNKLYWAHIASCPVDWVSPVPLGISKESGRSMEAKRVWLLLSRRLVNLQCGQISTILLFWDAMVFLIEWQTNTCLTSAGTHSLRARKRGAQQPSIKLLVRWPM
jgi:hypothetical protein